MPWIGEFISMVRANSLSTSESRCSLGMNSSVHQQNPCARWVRAEHGLRMRDRPLQGIVGGKFCLFSGISAYRSFTIRPYHSSEATKRLERVEHICLAHP